MQQIGDLFQAMRTLYVSLEQLAKMCVSASRVTSCPCHRLPQQALTSLDHLSEFQLPLLR